MASRPPSKALFSCLAYFGLESGGHSERASIARITAIASDDKLRKIKLGLK
jgi:hypothetical protein